ncbi:MAG: DoxX family membrane protein [Candidatus Nomurabacteria bacterium]|nr:DoxX family membrane protein [Candidatus Nomurabacteria bacterium]
MENSKLNLIAKASAPVILRLVFAFVFFYFGFAQLGNASMWTSYLPSWVGSLPISEYKFVLLNGWFEIISAVLLVLGAYVRPVALLLALHLFGIAASIGIDPTGVRDIGLAGATFAISLLGAGPFSVDEFISEETSTIQ